MVLGSHKNNPLKKTFCW